MKKTFLINLIFVLFLGGCNFSSGLKQQIIEAQEFVDNNEFEKATELYRKILKQNISSQVRLKINYQLAQIYALYLQTPKESLPYYEYVVMNATDPLWKVKSLEKLADIEFSYSKNFKSAIAHYQELLNFRPVLKGADFYNYRMALSYMERNEYQNAKKLLQNFIQDPNFQFIVDSYYQLALVSFYEQNWSEAIELFKEYLKRETRETQITEAKYLIANCYETNGQLREAYNIYYSLLQTYPQPEVIKNRLKSLYERRAARKR